MKKPKILFLDIETSYIQAGIFQCFTRFVPHSSIIKDWNIICGAWKWQGERKVHIASVGQRNIYDDKKVVEKLLKVIREADIVVGHNIISFDLKKIKTRALQHGITDWVQPQTVDTYRIAKNEFLFSSNALDYITKYLDQGKKLDTTRGLWLRIAQGDSSALAEMKKYNIHDVKIQEKVYNKMLPFITNHPNMNVILGSEKIICTNCGSSKIHRNGYRATRTGRYPRYRCDSCGAGFRGKSVIQTFEGR